MSCTDSPARAGSLTGRGASQESASGHSDRHTWGVHVTEKGVFTLPCLFKCSPLAWIPYFLWAGSGAGLRVLAGPTLKEVLLSQGEDLGARRGQLRNEHCPILIPVIGNTLKELLAKNSITYHICSSLRKYP